MNPKVVKLREEREKNNKKIASLQARNKKIDEDIISIENTDMCIYNTGKRTGLIAELYSIANI